MKKRIAVVGAGTAGIISLFEILPHVTNNWDVVSVYDPSKPILGIGESTNPNFTMSIQDATRFTLDDLAALDGTIKFGTKYKRWRKNDFVNPLFGIGYAIHFNNFKLKDFAFERFKKYWPEKFKEMHGDVTDVIPGKTFAQIIIDGRTEQFDYIIDCRGFPSDFKDYRMSNCSPVNHCIVYSVPPENQEPYTDHIAMDHGWMFGIPLQSRSTYGYLFNDTKSTREEVISDMSAYLGTTLISDKIIEYQFKSYYANKVYEGRVLKNGNRALFLEPLSATSIFVYIQTIKSFTDHLALPASFPEQGINDAFTSNIESLEDMLSFFYHGGSELDTEFWRHAKDLGQSRLKNSKVLEYVIQEFKNMDSMGLSHKGPKWFFTPVTLRIVDEKMGYNYFKSK
jgi:tryptophan halogenase